MSVEQALRDYLAGIPAITNVVGRDIYAGRRPEDAGAFCILIQQSSASSREYNLDGEDSCFAPRVEIDIWGRGNFAHQRIVELADEIRRKISGYSGPMGDLSVGVVIVDGDGWTAPTSPIDGSDKWYFRYSLSAEIFHLTTAPNF